MFELKTLHKNDIIFRKITKKTFYTKKRPSMKMKNITLFQHNFTHQSIYRNFMF